MRCITLHKRAWICFKGSEPAKPHGGSSQQRDKTKPKVLMTVVAITSALCFTWINTTHVVWLDNPDPATHYIYVRDEACNVSVLSHFEKQQNISVCQPSVFNNFLVNNEYFPATGHWEMASPGQIHTLEFVPDLCRIGQLHPWSLKGCIQKKKWKKIVTIGDSIGKRYHLGLIEVFRNHSFNCKRTKLEANGDSYMPDITYFINNKSIPNDTISVMRRACHSCGGRYVKCQADPHHNLVLEHLALNNLLDTTLTVKRKFDNGNISIPALSNTIDFYLKWYLKDSIPDLLIIGPPFVHVTNLRLQTNLRNLNKLVMQVSKLLPPTTTVVWMTQTRAFNFGSMDNKNVKLNQVLFKHVMNHITGNHSNNWNGFYDLHALSCPLKFLAKDGMHLEPWFYETVMRHLLTMLCS